MSVPQCINCTATEKLCEVGRHREWRCVPVDAAKVSTALTAALKADDAPLSSAYAFLAASHLGGAADGKKFHDMIEDVIAQADEVDETFLQVSCKGQFSTRSLPPPI